MSVASRECLLAAPKECYSADAMALLTAELMVHWMVDKLAPSSADSSDSLMVGQMAEWTAAMTAGN